jgi:hypothetical protein
MVVSRLFLASNRMPEHPGMLEPRPQLSTTITNANTNTNDNDHQCNTIWDECVYLKNPIPVGMIVSTPSDSIPLRNSRPGRSPTLQKNRQSAKHLPFPLQCQPAVSPSSMKDALRCATVGHCAIRLALSLHPKPSSIRTQAPGPCLDVWCSS